jgi:hypothetical protein
MATNSAVRNGCYGLVEKSCLLEDGKRLAVPVGGRGRGKLENGRTCEGDADPMGNNRVVNVIASMLIFGALLVEPRNL